MTIDVAEGRQVARIDLGAKSRPHSIVFMRDGRRVVATMEQSDQIALVDVVDRKVLRTYPTGGREGHMVRLSPDGARAFVASRGAEGTLSIISLAGDAPPVVVPTGAGAEGLAVTPDGREVMAIRSNHAGRLATVMDFPQTRSAELVAWPVSGGASRVVHAGTLGGKPHFSEDKLYLQTSTGLTAIDPASGTATSSVTV